MPESFDVQLYIEMIESQFRKHANKTRAAGAKAYMRNQFEYYGIASPDRRLLQQEFFTQHGIPPYELMPETVKELWEKPQRELQYFAMELCIKYKKQYKREIIDLIEFLITNKSWWDTVDFIAPKIFLEWTYHFPEETRKRATSWNKSDNIWLIRSSIIFQLHNKRNFDEKLLFDMILRQVHHKDFFIRKAIGWSLRQYAKTNRKAVLKFVNEHADKLSPLSYKEAMKNLK